MTGVSGSGKTELVELCRSVLERAGVSVSTATDESLPAGAAVVIDDVHHCDSTLVRRLKTLARTPDATVIVSSEPRFHDSSLRELRRELGTAGSAITLGPMSRADIVGRSGGTVSGVVAETIRVETGGVRAAVDVALTALRGRQDEAAKSETVVHEAISLWHQHRLRELDPATLDVLTIAGLHPTPDPDIIAATLGVDHDVACRSLDRARGSGFLSGTDTLLPSVGPALRAARGEHAVASTHRSLIAVLLDHGVLREDAAITAARSGISSPELADMLVAAAAGAPAERAVTLWSAALAAGAAAHQVNLPYADAAVRSGDLDTATRLADEALADGSSDNRREGVRIAAAVAARRGSYGRCADLYRWLGTQDAGADAPLGVVTLLATGDRAGADLFSAAVAAAPPTTDNSRSMLLATGLVTSLTTSRAAALGSVLRSASLARATDRAEPESASAIAALLCLHGGDLAGARAALGRSATPEAVRDKLFTAWTTMLGGDLTTAADMVGSCSPTEYRDQVMAHALTVAIARRRGDTGGLMNAWQDAAPVVAEMEVDLFGLLPLGELWLAAVRVGDTARLAHLVDDADRLLSGLGTPAAWTTAWSWYAVQAAILADDPAALVPYARQLGQAAADDSFAAALADAGRAWLRVMQGSPDVAEVEAAARKLEDAGLPWDAARLAGEAALRVDDTQSATALLQVARLVGGAPSPATPTKTPEHSGNLGTNQLSEREVEVARHLLLGLTYREIGARLYISAKTVEHHVARIRRRIGATSRSEMLSMLRASGYGPTKPD